MVCERTIVHLTIDGRQQQNVETQDRRVYVCATFSVAVDM